MAKQGMARPDWTHTQPRNDQEPVPLIQGKAKHGKEKAKPIIPGTDGADLKVYHNLKGDNTAETQSRNQRTRKKVLSGFQRGPFHEIED